MSKVNYQKAPCLRVDCSKTAHARGLCVTHYASASGAVLRHETTWTELEELGLSQPRDMVKVLTPFRALLEEARQQKIARTK